MTPENQIAPAQAQTLALSQPSSLSILERAIQGGVTSENVAVVKELLAMRREETAAANKADFNRAFFRLKTDISTMDFYADKSALTKSNAVAYTYCSESEISEKLEPVLFKHGFAMMFGQKQDGDRVVVEVTLMHASGHEEKREYSVRTGSTNAMKDATAADSGATTSAWRHLVIKLFGLKTRIKEESDAANIGTRIDFAQAQTLQEMVAEIKSKGIPFDEPSFYQYVAAPKIEEIGTANYDRAFRGLKAKLEAK